MGESMKEGMPLTPHLPRPSPAQGTSLPVSGVFPLEQELTV